MSDELDRPCPKCWAGVGGRCRDMRTLRVKYRLRPHPERLRMTSKSVPEQIFARTRNSPYAVACPTCNVPVDQDCIRLNSKAGKPAVWPHAARYAARRPAQEPPTAPEGLDTPSTIPRRET